MFSERADPRKQIAESERNAIAARRLGFLGLRKRIKEFKLSIVALSSVVQQIDQKGIGGRAS